MGAIVVGKPAIGVITFVPLGRLYPRLEVIAAIINRLALEPLLVNSPYSLPNNLGNLRSNLIASAPSTNHSPNKLFTAATYSVESK